MIESISMAKKREEVNLLELLPDLSRVFCSICSTLKELSEQLGVSLKEVRKWKSMGMPVTEYGDYDAGAIEEWAQQNGLAFIHDPVVTTVQAVAEELDVNRRTVAEWKSLGMPVSEDGQYDVDKIMDWVDQRDIKIGRKPRFSTPVESDPEENPLSEPARCIEDFLRFTQESGQCSAKEVSFRLTIMAGDLFRTLGNAIAATIRVAEGSREDIRNIGDEVAYCANLMNRKIVQAAYDRSDQIQPKANKKRRSSGKGAK